MIPYARLTPGPGFQPMRALLYYAQRLVVWPTARRWVASLVAAWVNWTQGASRGRRGRENARVLHDLKTSGIAMLSPLAPAAIIAAIADYFQQQPLVGPDGRSCWLADLPEGIASAAYSLETVINCPGLLTLINDPWILQLAAGYIGCKPTISSIVARWSFCAAGKLPVTQNFHRDVDDWRFFKLFIYLTDVDERSGPHCYVRASHRSAFSVQAREEQPEQLQARFGEDALMTVTGERGTTFVADTVGVHRGGATHGRPRLILVVQYSVLPVYAFQYHPVAVDSPSVDAHVNRLLLRAS